MRFFRSAHRVLATQPADVDALVDLYARVCATSPASAAAQAGPGPAAGEVASWLGGGFEVYHTAGDTAIVGAVRLSFPSGGCQLDELAVDPALRRRGHGRALVEHGVARARRVGASRVWTQVSPEAPGTAALFRRLGFREEDRLRATPWRKPVLLLELFL
jgi:ribosomal protein S18 acetylase RimI-like enzyme